MRYVVVPFLYLLACIALQEFFGVFVGDKAFYVGLMVVMVIVVISDRRLNP